jgi:hypothetical protein
VCETVVVVTELVTVVSVIDVSVTVVSVAELVEVGIGCQEYHF